MVREPYETVKLASYNLRIVHNKKIDSGSPSKFCYI